MARMPRPRKPYVQKEVTRHDKVVWYFRRGKEKRVRLPGVYGSREFNEAYNAALAGVPVKEKREAPTLTFRWLVDRFYQSPRYNALRPNTQRNYRLGLESACKTAASLIVHEITQADIQEGVLRKEATPYAAMDYLKSLRAVFAFAKASKLIIDNPAEGVEIKRPKTDGYHTWTQEEVERFQAKHAVGTQARLALDIMLYTGLRRSDAIVLGRQHVRSGKIHIRTMKTNADIGIPISGFRYRHLSLNLSRRQRQATWCFW